VLANDHDANGDPLTITEVTAPANGSVALNQDETITYAPNMGFTGTDSYTYTVCDNGTPPLCDSASVTMMV
jgi:hypothetical protein